MTASHLVRPDIEYKDSYLEALAEFHAEDRLKYYDMLDLRADFDGFVKILRTERGVEHQPLQDWAEPVPETVLWFVKDDQYLGTVKIRHRLNWHLEKWGGNIYFAIRPSMRGKGYGKKILTKSRPYANYIGLEKALITVSPDNVSAIEIIEGAGCTFEEETAATAQFPARRRYWMDCS